MGLTHKPTREYRKKHDTEYCTGSSHYFPAGVAFQVVPAKVAKKAVLPMAAKLYSFLYREKDMETRTANSE
jgi:hypothetical protein